MGGNLTGNDSLLSCSTMPGGPTKCGIVSTTNNWNEVVKEHIQVGIALHDVKKLIVIDHLDCGAYKACVLCNLSQPDLTLSVHETQYVKFTDNIKASSFFPHGSGSATPGSSIFSDGVTI
jgi:hypothetical protein